MLEPTRQDSPDSRPSYARAYSRLPKGFGVDNGFLNLTQFDGSWLQVIKW